MDTAYELRLDIDRLVRMDAYEAYHIYMASSLCYIDNQPSKVTDFRSVANIYALLIFFPYYFEHDGASIILKHFHRP
jgi:hypothetical protein